MSEQAVEQTLDLGSYRGQKIKATKVKLANASDGFDPSTTLEEPRIYEIGERLVLAVEVIVSAHQPKAVDLEAGEIEVELLQTFKCGTMAVIPASAVKKELTAAKKAEDERKAAKAKKPPVRRGQLKSVATEGPKAVSESLEAALGQVAEG